MRQCLVARWVKVENRVQARVVPSGTRSGLQNAAPSLVSHPPCEAAVSFASEVDPPSEVGPEAHMADPTDARMATLGTAATRANAKSVMSVSASPTLPSHSGNGGYSLLASPHGIACTAHSVV